MTQASELFRVAEDWSFWSEFQVRGAGFSTRRLLELRASGSYEQRRNAEREKLKACYSDPRLQEAIVWQNPGMARLCLFPWLSKALFPERAKHRKRERKLLAYLSRYCSKNDVIGFFGPIGWGRLGKELCLPEPGVENGLRARSLYEEPWLVERLLELWEREHDFLDALPLKLSVRLKVEGEHLVGDRGGRRRDGRRRLVEEERSLMLALQEEPRTWDQALEEGHSNEVILRCFQRGWLTRTLSVPSCPKPLEWLESLMLQRGTPHRYREILSRLKRSADSVQYRRGEPRELLAALQSFAQELEGETGQTPSRGAGQTYGGRQPLYEDCQRAGVLELPSARLESCRDGLAALLESSRWFCFHAAVSFRRKLREVYEGCAARYGSRFSASYFWDALMEALQGADPLSLGEVREDLAQGWDRLFGNEESLAGADALARARELFRAPHGGVPGARYHSVDLLFSEPSEGMIVLGEIHPGLHPYGTMSATHQHPDLQALRERVGRERAFPQVLPALHVPYTRSAHDSWHAPEDFHLLVRDHWGSWREPARTLRLGDLEMSPHSDGLGFRVSCGDRSWAPEAFFERELRVKAALFFSPFPVERHRARRSLGPLVVAREAWRFSTEELPFLFEKVGAERQAKAEEWARERALPELLFVRIESEVKPFLWDRRSVLSTDNLCALARREKSLKLEEMLPGLEDAWLPNPDGPGLCELRLVARDHRAWSELT